MFGIAFSQDCRGRIPGLVIITVVIAAIIIITTIINCCWLISSTAARLVEDASLR